jgi:iron complex transport system permease protein
VRSPDSPRRDLIVGVISIGFLLLVVSVLSLSVGAVPLSWAAALRGAEPARTILFDIRLPRVILAALVGATLSCAGVTFQTLLRNPLADPFILGVSGGAAAAAAIATAAGVARHAPQLVPWIAFAGAAGATALVFAMGRGGRGTDTTRLLLAGLVLNAFFSAIILVALAMTSGSDLSAALRWMMGGVFGATWIDAQAAGAALLIALAILTFVASDLRLLAFGEEDARGKGVNVERTKLLAFLAASLATGAAVAVAGIIGFVGLLVPHGVRMIWRRDYRVLLPLSTLAGAALLVPSDALSRVVVSPAELPLGAVTALLGVPFFFLLLRRGRR